MRVSSGSRSFVLAVVGMLLLIVPSWGVEFTRDIRPILSNHCFQCHGPDAEHREADLRLDVESSAVMDGDGEGAIDRENPQESELLARIHSTDPDVVMPPREAGKDLSPDQKKLITEWIESGAEWEQHWAYRTPERWPNPEIVQEARVRLEGQLAIDYVVPDYYARYPKPCMGGWARTGLNVTPSGKVLPCHAAESIDVLTFDNVKDKSLREIWISGEAFQAFRGTDWMEEPCKSCDRRELDWGGCRCQAFHFTGNANAVDPACSLSPMHEELRAIAEKDAASEEAAFSYRQF